jgi:hypothetical protein
MRENNQMYPACVVLQFGEDKQVSFGPMVTLQPPSSLSSVNDWGSANHDYASNILLSLDSSSFLACWQFREDLSTGHLHAFVLEVSGSSITNADTAVESQGMRIDQQSVGGHYAHLGFARAADSSNFVLCFSHYGVKQGLSCAPFSISGRAVSAVGQEVKAPFDTPNAADHNVVEGLTGTSAVVCSSPHSSFKVTQCLFMSWTAGDLNTLTYDAVKPSIPVKSWQRTLSRLSDTRAVLCYADKTVSTGKSFQACAMVEHGGSGLQMTEEFKKDPEGTPEQRAYAQKTIALGRNKLVTTYESQRRRSHVYTMTLDVDEQTGHVTKAGAEIKIDQENEATKGWVGALGSDRAFSVYLAAFKMYAVPQW